MADQLFTGLGGQAANPIELRKALLAERRLGDIAFCRRQLETISSGSTAGKDDDEIKTIYLAYLSTLYKHDVDASVIKAESELQFNKLYLASVTHASGPFKILLNLFGHAALTAREIDEKVLPYSFGHYDGLSRAFSSGNAYPAHTSAEEYVQTLERQVMGVSSDLSWIEAGSAVVAKREEIMAAVTIQKFFRAYKAKQTKSRCRFDTRPSFYCFTL